jgi:hypothetical protein
MEEQMQAEQMQAEQMQAEQMQAEQQVMQQIMQQINNDFFQNIKNALTVIEDKPYLVDFIKNFDEEGGFMFCSDKQLFEIYDQLETEGHSGSSFAITMRCCQHILNGTKTLNDYA